MSTPTPPGDPGGPPGPDAPKDVEIDKIKRDDEKPVEKFKAEKEHKEIEKIKADKEHPEKIKAEKEHPEKVKPDKEAKLEIKEHPEKIKPDKEAKLEVKEKPEKEVKEGKPEKEKHDGKEFKAELEKQPKLEKEKHDAKELKVEFEKQVPDKGGKEIAEGDPLHRGDPVLDPAVLLAHADQLQQAGQQLRHFVEQSMRPDLSGGALTNEPDIQDKPEGS
jgi:hypothetical protein